MLIHHFCETFCGKIEKFEKSLFVDIRIQPGGVTHARQRSIRDKQHRLDCERVAQQLLGKPGNGEASTKQINYSSHQYFILSKHENQGFI